MDKKKIRDFFNEWASKWDAGMVKDDEIMNIILDNAEITKDKDVLDVACGTGVMIDYYLDREVGSVIGVDLSDKMCEIASEKFKNNKNVRIICEDIEEYNSDKKFDAIIIYNSFPHFPDPEHLIAHLSSLLKDEGILTVAHGMSRDRINCHHSNVSYDVKRDLLEASELAQIFSKYLEVTTIISNDKMYQVAGRKID